MKKIFTVLFSILLLAKISFAQTTATNFTATDCAGNPHTLFTELDAGKVIVICWVMPCSMCASGATTDESVVQGYASSNPGRVKFYISDDAGNTSCSSLASWESSNSITCDATFDNTGNAINMSDYGSSGMPKTVVLGGTSHTVYFNYNGTPTVSALQTAINNALGATALAENNFADEITIFPNPSANGKFQIASNKTQITKTEIYNSIGEKIYSSIPQLNNSPTLQLDLSSQPDGIYFLKIFSEHGTAVKKIILTR